MEINPAYGYGQQNPECLRVSVQYDDIICYLPEGAKVNKLNEKVQEHIRQKPQRNTKDQAHTRRKCTGVNVILAIAIVAVLAIAVIAIIVSVLLTSNSNQEIQSLQLEIENLQTQYGTYIIIISPKLLYSN